MKSTSQRFSLSLLAITVIGYGLLVPARAVMAGETEGGNAWSRIIRHFDGTQTKSVKEGDKNQITEEKYDDQHILVAKRLFNLDARGRLRNGVIMDAKGKPLGSTEYGYNKHDVINEERLYNAKGQLIQRKFPPGSINIAQNAKHTIVFVIDPKNPTGPGTMHVSDDAIIQPVTSESDTFTPGLPIGKPMTKPSTGLPTSDAPVPSATATKGRKPRLFREKAEP